MGLKEQLMAKAVNSKHYQVDPDNPRLTKPRTWGFMYCIKDFPLHRRTGASMAILISCL